MWRQVRFGQKLELAGLIQEPDSRSTRALVMTLPGLGQAMSEKNYMFSGLRKKLTGQGYRIVQFDYRGHGDSAGELGDTSISTMTEDALQVLQEMVPTQAAGAGSQVPIILVGHALGAVVAMRTAKAWHRQTRTRCRVILLSPPIAPLPQSSSLFESNVLRQLKKEGNLDSQQLVPGYDYYTLSDFRMDQVEYVSALGAHLLYLHGQRLGWDMLQELDAIQPELWQQHEATEPLHVICGEQDTQAVGAVSALPGAVLHELQGVRYYYQHPAAMDQVLAIIEQLVRKMAIEGMKEPDPCYRLCNRCRCSQLHIQP